MAHTRGQRYAARQRRAFIECQPTSGGANFTVRILALQPDGVKILSIFQRVPADSASVLPAW